MSYSDRNLSCVDCGNSFVFTAEDQEYHASKGFENEPKRCASCRANRKADRGDTRGGGGGGGGGYRQMHDVVCAECGRNTQVPFQPTGSRPVYCSDCFSKRAPVSSRY